jgi:hypothetical protein
MSLPGSLSVFTDWSRSAGTPNSTGMHDRPWGERPVFGTVRWMSRAGMDRKTGVGAYIKEIEYLEQTGKEPIT